MHKWSKWLMVKRVPRRSRLDRSKAENVGRYERSAFCGGSGMIWRAAHRKTNANGTVRDQLGEWLVFLTRWASGNNNTVRPDAASAHSPSQVETRCRSPRLLEPPCAIVAFTSSSPASSSSLFSVRWLISGLYLCTAIIRPSVHPGTTYRSEFTRQSRAAPRATRILHSATNKLNDYIDCTAWDPTSNSFFFPLSTLPIPRAQQRISHTFLSFANAENYTVPYSCPMNFIIYCQTH